MPKLRFLAALFAAALAYGQTFAGMLAYAQTGVPVDQLRSASTDVIVVVYVPGVGFREAKLDTASVQLVAGPGNTYTLRAIAASIATRKEELYTVVTGQSVTLANATQAELDIYRNGVKQRVGVDFTVTGAVVTFTSGQQLAVGDFITAVYR